MVSAEEVESHARAQGFIAQSLVWDAHAGIFPTPDTDLNEVPAWRAAGVDYVSLNIGFDVIGWADDDLRRFLGENFLRVTTQTWKS